MGFFVFLGFFFGCFFMGGSCCWCDFFGFSFFVENFKSKRILFIQNRATIVKDAKTHWEGIMSSIITVEAHKGV